MFDVGFWELTLLFVVALVIVGPERLPRLARTVGLWIGKAQRIVSEVKEEVEREIRVEEIKKSISQQSGSDEIKKLADRVKSINSEVQETLTDATKLDKKNTLPHGEAQASSPSSDQSDTTSNSPAK
jgi:sec-independent protein translocase protein TatB